MPQVQIPLLGSTEIAEAGKAKDEIRKQKHREADNRYRAKEYYQNNREARKKYNDAYHKQRNKALRRKILEVYGNYCECCGESAPEFLALDHKNGGGTQHRKKLFGYSLGGKNFYHWLRRNAFPRDGYRILCHNCNCARGFYGSCPHTQISTPIDLFLQATSSL